MRSCNPRLLRRAAFFKNQSALAQAAARQNAARFVSEITLETRRALASVIQRGIAEGISPDKLSKMIRPMIGLTRRQAMAVMNAQSSWEAAGLGSKIAEQRAQFYAAKLLRRRAEMIAKTEIVNAAHAGQLAAWKQAVKDGVLSPKAKRVWVAERDACERCRALHRTSVGLEGAFGDVRHPPLHPFCRCSVQLVAGGKRVSTDVGFALVS